MAKQSNHEELEESLNLLENESDKLRRAMEELKRYQFMIESAQDAIFIKIWRADILLRMKKP